MTDFNPHILLDELDVKRDRKVRPFSMFEPTEAPAPTLRKNPSCDDLVRDAQVRKQIKSILEWRIYPDMFFWFDFFLFFSSLPLRLRLKSLRLFPTNQKDLLLCRTANRASTQEPSLKPNPKSSSLNLPAALYLLHRARLFLYPPSRTSHLQLLFDLSPQSLRLPASLSRRS